MKEQSVNRVKLGTFVLVAITCLILGLYFIGSKKNIFHSTINVSANFANVGGLLQGNNVRFNGINIGTVSKVYPVSDTAIKVEFTIDKETTKFITQKSIASIGTDGLLGNKLVNISPAKEPGPPVKEGDQLKTQAPVQMDAALRTLNATNDNLKIITENLKGVSEKFNDNNSLWHLLSDSILADNVRTAVVRFKVTGENTAIVTGNLSKIVKDMKAGKGTMGALLTDTALSGNLKQTIVNFKSISDSFAIVSGNFKNVSDKLKNGEGSVGQLLTDTTFVHKLNLSLDNIKSGSENFNENMEALKHSWPFKKYFRQQKKNKNNTKN
jgi:phospholipid/cholesterol/gamma-HCH transport system substrate-binding protein